MNKLIKFVWTFISMVPLIFVVALVFLFDYLWSQSFCTTWILPLILFIISLSLIFICYLLICFALKRMRTIKFEIEEIESKDNSVAGNIITYLLPLVTITVASVNWVAFGGLILVLVFLLLTSKVVQLNPILYLFKYRYYTIKATSGIKYTLISKKKRMDIITTKTMIEIFPEIYLEVEDENV